MFEGSIPGLPDGTLVGGVHGGSGWAVVRLGEVDRIAERTDHPDRTRRMDRRPDLRQGVLVAHRAAPDLGVVEEEELVVGELDAWESGLLAVGSHPLLVRLQTVSPNGINSVIVDQAPGQVGSLCLQWVPCLKMILVKRKHNRGCIPNETTNTSF